MKNLLWSQSWEIHLKTKEVLRLSQWSGIYKYKWYHVHKCSHTPSEIIIWKFNPPNCTFLTGSQRFHKNLSNFGQNPWKLRTGSKHVDKFMRIMWPVKNLHYKASLEFQTLNNKSRKGIFHKMAGWFLSNSKAKKDCTHLDGMMNFNMFKWLLLTGSTSHNNNSHFYTFVCIWSLPDKNHKQCAGCCTGRQTWDVSPDNYQVYRPAIFGFNKNNILLDNYRHSTWT